MSNCVLFIILCLLALLARFLVICSSRSVHACICFFAFCIFSHIHITCTHVDVHTHVHAYVCIDYVPMAIITSDYVLWWRHDNVGYGEFKQRGMGRVSGDCDTVIRMFWILCWCTSCISCFCMLIHAYIHIHIYIHVHAYVHTAQHISPALHFSLYFLMDIYIYVSMYTDHSMSAMHCLSLHGLWDFSHERGRLYWAIDM